MGFLQGRHPEERLHPQRGWTLFPNGGPGGTANGRNAVPTSGVGTTLTAAERAISLESSLLAKWVIAAGGPVSDCPRVRWDKGGRFEASVREEASHKSVGVGLL